MNIIQLYINDMGNGTPFEAGLNTIVIPTSLFTETVFNAHVQNETLSATPIYSPEEDKFKFISVGREGNTEQACDEIDFVIIRFDISSEDAMEILDLLLTCLVNETNNQTGVVYSYVSTKLNGTSATMMNLPISVLQYVPWYCDFSDSPKGPKPQTFADWFWAPLIAIAKAIIGIIFFIVMAIVLLVILIIKFFIDIFMEALPILQYILWLIIRVIVLIFVWIMFAITLLLFICIFLLFAIPIIAISTLTQWSCEIRFNSITMQDEDHFIEFKYSIGFEFFAFLAIYLPTLYSSFTTENSSITLSYNLFKTFEIPSIDFISNILYEDDPQGSSVDNHSRNQAPKTSTSTDKELTDFTATFIMGFDLVAVIAVIIGFGTLITKGNKFIQAAVAIIPIIALIVGLTAIIINRFKEEEKSKGFWFGFGIGSMVACIITAVIVGIVGSIDITNEKKWRNIIGVGIILLSLISLVLNVWELSAEVLGLESDDPRKFAEDLGNDVLLSITSLIFGAIYIGLANTDDINQEMMEWGYLAFAFLLIFTAITLLEHFSE